MNRDENAFSRELRQALRASERLDADTAARLRAARTRALQAAPARRAWRWAVPATAMAAVLAAALWLPRPAPVAPRAAAGGVEAIEVLTDEQSPEFYQDLELYEWLEQEAGHA